jgi:hypothetical protein
VNYTNVCVSHGYTANVEVKGEVNYTNVCVSHGYTANVEVK